MFFARSVVVIRITISLRTRLHSAHHLKLVTLLLVVVSEDRDSDHVVVFDWKKLYKSVWQHSEFMPVMSGERDELTKGTCMQKLKSTLHV